MRQWFFGRALTSAEIAALGTDADSNGVADFWAAGGGTGAYQVVASGDFGGNDYELLWGSQPIDWQTARQACVSRGGGLATISSQGENDFLRDLAEDAWSAGLCQNGPWIGFTDQAQEGTFQWDSGEAVTYTQLAARGAERKPAGRRPYETCL